MELERRRRRKDRKAVVAKDARSIHDLSDDLLWRILLGLDSPVWLIRASYACKRWRRVVTGDAGDQGRTFLRLARSLHPPTIVGQYHKLPSCDHLFVPSSPPPAPIDVSRFAVDDDILQKSRWGWHVVDCHGGLVLLRMISGSGSAPSSHIVYDPLTRQHHEIYSPPRPDVRYAYYLYGVKDTFILDGDDGDISISNFRVIYLLNGTGTGCRTCVFSTANGREDWLFPCQPADAGTGCLGQLAGRVDGCLYVSLQTGSIIALDNASLLFSKVELPIRIRTNTSDSLFRASTFTVVVNGGVGALGRPTSPATTKTSIVHVRGEELELFRHVHGTCEWVLEHSIPNLPEVAHGLSICLEKNMRWMTMVDAIADGTAFAILSACSLDSYPNRRRWFFSFDVNTMELRVLPQELYGDRNTMKIFNYTLPWPRFLRAWSCS